MQKMLILSGLPASGKSEYAKRLMSLEPFWFRINWDDMRAQTPDYRFSKENERKIQDLSYAQARDAFEYGKNVLVDNTNLTDASIGKWARLAGEFNIPVEVKKFDTSIDECIRRDDLRFGRARVGRVVIERMALANGLIQFPKDRKIVLVDVDGTLADCGHRRKSKEKKCRKCLDKNLIFFHDEHMEEYGCCPECKGTGLTLGTDWDHFYRPELIERDPPFSVVVDWVQELYKTHTVLIVSGRPADRAGKETVRWLEKNRVPYHHIFMRNGGDKRDDVIVKQEILNKILDIVPKTTIAFSIDDRNRVVDMWRSNGLKCYQVVSREDGDF